MQRPDVKATQLFINGQFVDAKSGKKFPVEDPSTGATVCQVAHGAKEDIDLAVIAARTAFNRKSEWRCMNPSKKAALIFKLASLIERDNEYIAKLDALDCGKTVDSARGDVQFAIDILRYNAGWVDKICGKMLPMNGKHIGLVRKEPVGLVGAITPWNYPFLLAVLKLAPALACGNVLILKPAEQTPLSALYLAKLVQEAGFP
ncbi:Aldehyde dehydrogenase, partial [Cichlidogyrus casuarinus]